MAARRSGLSLLASLLAALALVPAACIQDDGSRFNPVRDITEVSEDDEREIGFQFDQEIRRHVSIIEDPVIATFINDLGQEIVRGIEPQPFVYRFRVVQDPSLNAFAVPGGYIYFHSGTLLAAGSIDELAGVMGHEVAHVKGHHYARMREKTQIPDLLVGLAGMAAAVATGEPGLLVATQAANVAAKLSFTREFENEADQYGSVFMTRAGYGPAAIARFFERILQEERATPHGIPPYLYSHPDVEDRIAMVRQRARKLRPTGSPNPRFSEELREVQARLAYLSDTRRQSAPPPIPPANPHRIDALLEQAASLASADRVDEALFVLARAETLEPHDPRAPFAIGDLLAAHGRQLDAVAAYRRTIKLDPTRAQVFFRLGLAQRALGNRHSAVQAFEQAARRSIEGSALGQRADWHVETLIFPLLVETGFADGTAPDGATPFGSPIETAAVGATQLVWYGQLNSRYANYAEHLRIRWLDPHGTEIAETPVEPGRGDWVSSVLELPDAATAGAWSAELSYQGEALEQHSLTLQRSR
ncbi:MAG: M48 family metalloprotease [Deltaproteobacteria bacterium]|nr:M48 family metalloprotease [Deltaproteobacteria bacterium]MBW2359929.1 M48 family metalloprotease [Deltaproteobacteria bacterium]